MQENDQNSVQERVAAIRLEASETAQALLAAFDVIFDSCDRLREQCAPDNGVAQSALARIYETGAVQDVARQRLEKIARIAARIADPSLPEDDPLLAGPQNQGEGMNQSDINRLLGDMD